MLFHNARHSGKERSALVEEKIAMDGCMHECAYRFHIYIYIYNRKKTKQYIYIYTERVALNFGIFMYFQLVTGGQPARKKIEKLEKHEKLIEKTEKKQ
jgi:hypothetical protein